MTMPNIQLNSKFVNNMSPEWDRFVTAVKLNKGLKETNHEQLYAYLKQHEKHVAQDRLIIERITPATNDQLAFVSTVQPHAQSSHVQSHQYPSSSTNPQSPQYPQFPETSQIDSEQRFLRATLPQTNNQLRTSSNTRNQATIQDGRVVVQNVQGRQNQNQRYFARGNGTAGNGGAQNRAGNANAGQGKPVKCYNCNGVGHIARNCTQPKRPQNSDYFKDKMLLMQAQENGAVLDEEELLFLAGEQGNTFDADVDNQPVQDLALNEDNIFQADDRQAKKAQPALYDGDELLKPHHVPVIVSRSEEELELVEATRNKLHVKMNDLCRVEKFTEVRAMKTVFENLEAEVDQNETDLRSGEIERKNLLITNENLVANLLKNRNVLPTLNLRNKIQNDDHDSMIKHFSKLEVEHFNLQLKYQNLKERFGNKKPVTSSDAPSFDSLFVIGKLNEQIQSRGNTIRELKEKISRLTKKNSDADPIFDLKALVSQNKDLTAKLNALHDLNERFRAENAKVKQHYKELYDSIKITRAKTTDQNNSLLSEIENLKAQLKDNSKCVTIPDSKPKVLAPGRYPIDVEPIPPRLKKNREVHLHYIKHLKENVETLREIVEDAKVERPLDTSLASACRYTKHSQELLEYVIGTCPKDFGPSDKQNASTNSLRKKRVNFVEPCETSTHNTPPQVEHQKINSTNAPGIPSTGVKGASAASRSKPRSNTKKDRTLPARSALKQVEAHSRMNKSNEKQENRVDSSISFKRYHWKPTGRIFPLGDQFPLTRITKPKALLVKQWKPTGRLIPLDGQCPLVRPLALTNSPNPVASNLVVHIILWYLDSGCSKHMTGDSSRLRNFVKKFIGTVRFGNDHFGAIMGYRDYAIDLEVAFRKHTCFVRDLDGVDLIKRSRGTNLYTISVDNMMRSSPICLLSKASKNKSWLWHRRLNHLNFGTLNDLARKDIVRGLPRLKFEKDHLCSACQLGKSRKATYKPKTINTIMEVLHTLHMDLCGPMRVQSINGKKYILAIVDDYSRFTWVKFLRSKDETPAFVINLLKQLQVGLNKTVRFVRTDNGTEFVNKDLIDYYENVGITQENTVPRTPQHDGVVERRNRTFVEAAKTMLIFSKAPLFLLAEAVATACYTQN
ncbi:retrovirus-related pol polyprotein from transposon TNT 1-94 [Tanacetum coccineum]